MNTVSPYCYFSHMSISQHFRSRANVEDNLALKIKKRKRRRKKKKTEGTQHSSFNFESKQQNRVSKHCHFFFSEFSDPWAKKCFFEGLYSEWLSQNSPTRSYFLGQEYPWQYYGKKLIKLGWWLNWVLD